MTVITIQNSQTNNQANPSPKTSDSLFLAREIGYESSFYIIQHLLDECEKAPFEDQRVAITEKIFNHLIENPKILIYDSEFRNSVIAKMNQLETHVAQRVENLKKAEYDEAIKILKTSLRLTVINSAMRASIYKNIREISETLNMYQEWAKGDGLKKCFSRLRAVLNEIKDDSNYAISK
jgi:hypothetical protein